jgi:hypothetical protein
MNDAAQSLFDLSGTVALVTGGNRGLVDSPTPEPPS